MNARPFDPQWTTDAPDLAAYLDQLCHHLTSAETRLRRRKPEAQESFEASIKAIVLDLYRALESDPELEVGIPSGTDRLQNLSKSRYGASFISARTFQDALGLLISQGLVVNSTPYWHDSSGKTSRLARYQATGALLLAFGAAGASITQLRRHNAAEGIRLKDNNKRLIEYGDIQFANDTRDRLQIINAMLQAHWADIALPDDELAKHKAAISGERNTEASQSFDFAARTLHRVFNNDDWEQGGRFYGAWWISIPSELRPFILIDGKRTVEVDYSGLHAAMLYAKQGKVIPDDPYAECASKWSHEGSRKLVKLTFNALLNTGDTKKISPIDGFTEELMGLSWQGFLSHIIESFPEFAEYFGTGVGLRLQYKDSLLAEAVMLRFAELGYACLPVHDSFIVHHALQDDLTSIMQAVFERMFDSRSHVSFEIGKGEAVVPSGEFVKCNFEDLLEVSGYEQRLESFRQAME